MDKLYEQAQSQLFTVKLGDISASRLTLAHSRDILLQSVTPQAPGQERLLARDTIVDKKFRIVKLLGRGGMGAVYQAYHLQLDKDVALKTFVTGALTQEAWSRFQREAQAIARLNHLNVVQVYDFGEDSEGIPYYTMELLKGQSLADLIVARPLSLTELVKIFILAARGLASAHARGIVHRDIKPGNIFIIDDAKVRFEESVKLVDFGIASLATESQSTTIQGQSGAVFGSPLYMSPEQFKGVRLTRASDIYSYGISLFEALAGSPPFFGENVVETMIMHLSTPAPLLSDVLPDVDLPQRLVGLVQSLLAKEINDRPADMARVEQELQLVLDRLQAQSPDAQISSLPRTQYRRAGAGSISADADGENEMDIDADVPPGFWQRSTIATVALTLLILLGIVAGVVVWHKPLQAFLGMQKPDPQSVQSIEGAKKSTEVGANSSSNASAIGDTAADFSRNAFENLGQNIKMVESAKGAILDTSLVTKVAAGSFDRTTADERKHNLRHFVFPPGMVIGNFVHPASGEFDYKVASGDVVLGKPFWLEVNAKVEANPDLLEGFRPDSLEAISSVLPLSMSDKHVQKLANWESVCVVNFDKSTLTDKSLDVLMRLPHLVSLGVARSRVSIKRVGDLMVQKGLQGLNLAGLKGVSSMLNRQDLPTNVTFFELDDCELTAADLQALTRFKRLEVLSIRDNPGVTDASLEALKTLPRLKQLDVRGSDITSDAAVPLSQCRALRLLRIDTSKWTDQERERLQSRLPYVTLMR